MAKVSTVLMILLEYEIVLFESLWKIIALSLRISCKGALQYHFKTLNIYLRTKSFYTLKLCLPWLLSL